MFRLGRILKNLTICAVFACSVFPAVAQVPVTVEEDFGAGGLRERETCDPEFWDVLTNRAWMEAQREITQNQNIIARPDSVLSMTCFDSVLDHIAAYSDDHFPSEPREAEGELLGGFWTELALNVPGMSPLDGDRTIGGNLDPYLSGGFLLYSVLEILVLDQLMDDVSTLGNVDDGINLALCGGTKETYIEDNFPNLMIGDRAKNEPPPLLPAWSSINAQIDDNVSRSSSFNGCSKMNSVWMRSKCYDFATESELDVTPPSPSGVNRHDGFYSLEQYRDTAGAGNDFRTEASMCDIPQTDGLPVGLDPSDVSTWADIACQAYAHNLGTSSVSPYMLAALLLPGDAPTWDTGFDDANPDPGTAGALDSYLSFLNLRDYPASTVCAPPIQIGYMVRDQAGGLYVDSVCPTPGCWFNPFPTPSGTGTGTCTRP